MNKKQLITSKYNIEAQDKWEGKIKSHPDYPELSKPKAEHAKEVSKPEPIKKKKDTGVYLGSLGGGQGLYERISMTEFAETARKKFEQFKKSGAHRTKNFLQYLEDSGINKKTARTMLIAMKQEETRKKEVTVAKKEIIAKEKVVKVLTPAKGKAETKPQERKSEGKEENTSEYQKKKEGAKMKECSLWGGFMNKKQLITLWVVGLWCAYSIYHVFNTVVDRKQNDTLIAMVVPVLIVGVLCFLTFKK